MTTGLVVPSDLQAHAKWSTGLHKLDASDASDGKDSHSGITSLRSCYSMENVEC